ncbi:MAG: hypothetical protein F6K19_44320 [Cyanothece sp. SIO1E1]|nr:hypothetical protein [Cyanothece sp. SIO1E1]
MSQNQRRDLIGRNLGIKPISHGQIYTCQIAISEPGISDNIPFERSQAIENSLIGHQSNLVPLIVRRTEAYDEDIDYEVVYGADWYLIAQKLDIEMLWAWVFDITDEQVAATKEEMESLLGSSEKQIEQTYNQVEDRASFESLLDTKMELISNLVKQSLLKNRETLENSFTIRAKEINYRFDDLNSIVSNLAEQIEDLNQRLENINKTSKSIINFSGPKINLLTAKDHEIESALLEVGTQDKHINSALEAINYWRQSDQGLTFKNLRKSIKSGSDHKILNFATGTYNKLEIIGEILE